MNILISGGCKNGKSGFAQRLAVKLSPEGKRYYVATMIPYDDEDRKRIALHIADRAELGFGTLETGRDIATVLEKGGRDATYLVDSVTALLLNEMFPDMHSGAADQNAAKRCANGLLKIAKDAKNAVFVTDYIYSDAARYDEFTESYRSSLAYIDKVLAGECDTVIELCAGNVSFIKGGINL